MLIELEVRAGPHGAHRRNRRGQIHHGRCAGAARRRQGRRRSRARGRRARRGVRHVRHQRMRRSELRAMLDGTIHRSRRRTARCAASSPTTAARAPTSTACPCPLQLLRDVGALIVDIHGQHEFQSLMRASAQRELLDDFGKNIELAGRRARGAQDLARAAESHGRARRQGARSRLAHRTAALPGRRTARRSI